MDHYVQQIQTYPKLGTWLLLARQAVSQFQCCSVVLDRHLFLVNDRRWTGSRQGGHRIDAIGQYYIKPSKNLRRLENETVKLITPNDRNLRICWNFSGQIHQIYA